MSITRRILTFFATRRCPRYRHPVANTTRRTIIGGVRRNCGGGGDECSAQTVMQDLLSAFYSGSSSQTWRATAVAEALEVECLIYVMRRETFGTARADRRGAGGSVLNLQSMLNGSAGGKLSGRADGRKRRQLDVCGSAGGRAERRTAIVRPYRLSIRGSTSARYIRFDRSSRT